MENTEIKQKVENFFKNFKKVEFAKGTNIIYPNDQINDAYYIANGFVREYSVQGEKEVTIHIFTAGSFFPMTAIISDIENRYFMSAFSECSIYIAPKPEVISFLKREPDVLFDLTRRLLFGLDKLTSRIDSLSAADSSERVGKAIDFIERHFGEIKNDIHKFTHEDIASIAGVSRETVTRELAKE